MSEDLKTRFEQLVADPPPPSAVPSEAVFARVRTVRRRRTALVGGLAVVVIAGISLVAGNLTDIGGAPPVTNTPGAPKTVITGPPTAPPAKPKPPIQVALTMTVKGRTLTPRATVSGKAFMPKVVPEGTLVPDDTSFLNLSAGTTLDYGDGYQSGTDGGGLQCAVTKLKTRAETYEVEPHMYARPGTYKFVYKVSYCGTRGLFTTTVVKQVTIR